MFAESLDGGASAAAQPEKPLSPWEESLVKLSQALDDDDWHLVIDLLETWPPLSQMSEAEAALARESVSNLCRTIEKDRRQGKVFSSESLSDLEEPLFNALAAKKREYGL